MERLHTAKKPHLWNETEHQEDKRIDQKCPGEGVHTITSLTTQFLATFCDQIIHGNPRYAVCSN